jgi:polar amino acid transport system substrate-binding protein
MQVMRSRWLWLALALAVVIAAVVLWEIGRPSQDRVWARIQDSGIWRVGMDPSFPPFETLDAEGNLLGFDVDLANAIASRWGVQVAFQSTGFDGLLAALWADKADSVISALPIDPRMTRDVAYSVPYFEAGLLLVVSDTGPAIEGTDDLAGRRLAVEWGSEADVQGRELRRRLEGVTLLPLPRPDDALAAVAEGDADAALVDAISLRQFRHQWATLSAVGPPIVSVPYSIAVPIEAPQLLEAVNEALNDLDEEGVLAGLEAEWFDQ